MNSLKPLLLRTLPFILFLLAGVVSTVPFFSRTQRAPNTGEAVRMLWTDDLPNHLAYSKEFDKVVRSGIVYPRWLPDINNGYGIAMMLFYPPGLHYFATVVHAFIGDWMNTYFVITVLALVFSGLALYRLSRVFFGRPASTIAALFYMLSPFHIFNFYYQGAVPQLIGYVFMPWVLYFAYSLGTKGRLIHYASLGLVYGLYLLTHLPVSYLFTYALALYAVLWAVRERDFRILLRVAGGMSLGLLLSAIYWLPAALESKYVYEWASEYMPYHASYITLLESGEPFWFLINTSFWLSVAPIVLSMWTLWARQLKGDPFEWRKTYKSDSAYSHVRIWIVLAITATLMSTAVSLHVSKLIPRIDVATPPWRWLAIASVFSSLLLAGAVERLPRVNLVASWKKLAYPIAIALLCAVSMWITVRYAILEPVRNRADYVIPAAHIDSGFTPKNSTPPDQLSNGPRTTLEPESGSAEVLEWEPQHRVVAVKSDQLSELRLKTYNFPGWTARIDGNIVPMLSDKDGSQQIEVPPGTHVVQATFENTWPCTVGAFLSGFAFMGVLGLSIATRVRRGIPLEAGFPSDNDNASSVGTAVSSTRKAIPLIVAGGAVVMIIGGALLFTRGNRSKPEGPRSSASGSNDKPALARSLRPGAEVQLYLPGQDSVLIALDEKGLDDAIAALSTKDKSALDALVNSSRALRVPANTSARVLEVGTGKIKVRILEGEHVMSDGWVPERWLR
jgi:hypothetical protein